MVWSERQRKSPSLKNTGLRFRWDDSTRMHISVESLCEMKRHDAHERAATKRDAVIGDCGSVKHHELITVRSKLDCFKSKTAEDRVGDWIRLDVIVKDSVGQWVKAWTGWGLFPEFPWNYPSCAAFLRKPR